MELASLGNKGKGGKEQGEAKKSFHCFEAEAGLSTAVKSITSFAFSLQRQ